MTGRTELVPLSYDDLIRNENICPLSEAPSLDCEALMEEGLGPVITLEVGSTGIYRYVASLCGICRTVTVTVPDTYSFQVVSLWSEIAVIYPRPCINY